MVGRSALGFGFEFLVESWIEGVDLTEGEPPVERDAPASEFVGLEESGLVVGDWLHDELMVVDDAWHGSFGPAQDPLRLVVGKDVVDAQNAAERSDLQDDGAVEADLADEALVGGAPVWHRVAFGQGVPYEISRGIDVDLGVDRAVGG